MGGGRRGHDATVPAVPRHFRLRLRLRTPLELENERLGRLDWLPHFRAREYRILWGNEAVTQDFTSAPAILRPLGATGPLTAVPITIPRAYYGQVDGSGLVSRDDIVETGSGSTILQLGEYRDAAPHAIGPELWAVDQRAPRQHFHPLVEIPLNRCNPPADAAASRQVEIWWRLWNLGQITEERFPAHPPAGSDAAAAEAQQRPFANANQLAKARWNRVRRVFGSGDVTRDEAFLNDLIRIHDGEEPPR